MADIPLRQLTANPNTNLNPIRQPCFYTTRAFAQTIPLSQLQINVDAKFKGRKRFPVLNADSDRYADELINHTDQVTIENRARQ